MIGENGINLSGGQRARVSLARALYARSEIVLLDDPLAAVDAHVAEHLFTTIRSSKLAEKRLIFLVTNQVSRLNRADRIIVLAKGGEMLGFGTYEELVRRGIDFHDFAATTTPTPPSTTPGPGEDGETTPPRLVTQGSSVLINRKGKEVDAETRKRALESAKATSTKDLREKASQLFVEEARPRGKGFMLFKRYAKAAGPKLTSMVLMCNIFYSSAPAVAQIMLAQLTSAFIFCRTESCQRSTSLFWLG